MKLTYLGTCAAEGIPALFCRCPVCQAARINKGKDIRTRSQALINDDLLIDYPPDTYLHVLNYGLDLDKIQNIVITHSHSDHLLVADLLYRSDHFSKMRNPINLGIYGNADVIKAITGIDSTKNEMSAFLDTATLNEIQPFKKLNIGEYSVYPLLANHKQGENCYIYIIEDKHGKSMLYGHDTGYFPEATWEFMKDFKLDLISLDCTCVFLDVENGHMGMACCNKVKNRLLEMNVADDNTKFILHHFSHNGNYKNFDDIVEKATKLGFDVSYDTKVIEF